MLFLPYPFYRFPCRLTGETIDEVIGINPIFAIFFFASGTIHKTPDYCRFLSSYHARQWGRW